MDSSDRDGQIVTFYSFKGGVGRTMALANVATLLACRGLRVLVVDFDLDAPGLGRYLPPPKSLSGELTSGVVEFFSSLRDSFDARFADDEAYSAEPTETVKKLREIIEATLDRREHIYIAKVTVPDGPRSGTIDVMPAGRFDDKYNARRESLDWKLFYERYAEAFFILADAMRARWDCVLVDSRTGLSDVASVCTAILPDTLVAVLVPNAQSLDGVIDVVPQAAKLRKTMMWEGPTLLAGVVGAREEKLEVLPLLSRVENAEDDRKRQWINRICERFEGLREVPVLRLPAGDLRRYFEGLRVPYRTRYAFGEEIAATHESTAEIDGMATVFDRLALRLVASSQRTSLRPWMRDVSSSVAVVEAEVLSTLDRHPYVVARLASCGLGEVPTAITRALFSLRAAELARTFNHALFALEKDPAAVSDDRRALAELFRACLRYAVDWRDAVKRGREALRDGRNAIELPLRKAPLAELVLSAIDGRSPEYGRGEHDGLVGSQQVSLPAVLEAPTEVSPARFVEVMVHHLASTVFPDLDVAKKKPASREAIADVEGTLRARGYERPGGPRPYYLVFDQEDDRLWRIACESQRANTGLPSLRLVRLIGDVSADEAVTAAHVAEVEARLRTE